MGFAPKIHQIYQHKEHTYILMENLISQGYKLLIKFRLTKKIIKTVVRAFKILHDNCLVHGDAHCYNIFYNKEKDSIKFIDFSMTHFCRDPIDALKQEKFTFDFGPDFKFVHTNWYKIKDELYSISNI